MELPETEREVLDHLDRMTRSLDPSSLSRFTTAEIARALSISRNLASQYLNDLVRRGAAIKAGGHPVYYLHKKGLERFLQTRLDEASFASVRALLSQRPSSALGFARGIGYDQSLSSCVEQLAAAIEYPPAGLPMLLVGDRGTGKTFLARLAFEYAQERGIVGPEAEFAVVDCSRYQGDQPGFAAMLESMESGASGDHAAGLFVLKNVESLASAALELLLSRILHDPCDDEAGTNAPHGARLVRFALTTSNPLQSAFVRSLSRRMPIVVPIPAYRDRPVQERESLALWFLRDQGRRMGTDVSITRGALRCLVEADFDENIRELAACIANCCAQAFLHNDQEGVCIKAYELPPHVLSSASSGLDADSSELVEATRVPLPSEGDCSALVFDPAIKALDDFRAGILSSDDLVGVVTECAHEFEDQELFGSHPAGMAPTSSRLAALELVAADVLTAVGEAHGVVLARKLARFIASGLCLSLGPHEEVARWELLHRAKLLELTELVSKRFEFGRAMLDQLSAGIWRALGAELRPLVQLSLLVELGAYEQDPGRRRCAGIILSHGYATASSIADAANRILHARVFEAIDMTYDQQISDIAGPLAKMLDQLSWCHELAVLVDMGSLEGICESIPAAASMAIGTVNNVSTALAVEVGAGLMQGRSLRKVLEGARSACAWHLEIFEGAGREDAVLICADGGVEAAKRICSMMLSSLPVGTALQLVPCSLGRLQQNGYEDQLFSKWAVQAIVGTTNPHVEGVGFVSLDEVVSGRYDRLDQVFSHYLDAAGIVGFHASLVKNFTLRNVVESITVLNPERLFDEIGKAIGCLSELTGFDLGGSVTAGLYVHLCCLVERLVMRQPIETYADEEGFAGRHQEFIDAFRQSFADIAGRYGIEVPLAEIAYAWDYVRAKSVPGSASDTQDYKGDLDDF